MTAALATQTSAETTVSGFRSGIFTYLLTRYLWQTGSNRPIKETFVDLSRITRSEVDKLGGSQNPIYFTQPGSNLDEQPPYLLTPVTPAADAVVRSQAGSTVEFWLGGMTPRGLEDAESIFEVIDDQGQVLGKVSQTRRDGLIGSGTALDGTLVQPGQLLREHIRGIPSDLTLRVGLHESLGPDAELVRQAFANFDRVTVVEANGQTDTDYLLGRFDNTAQAELELQGQRDRADLQTVETNSVGLFTNALEPLPTTFGSQYEDFGMALERLSTRLRLLLANRALKSIVNTEGSALAVEVEVVSNQRGGVGTIRSGALQPNARAPQSQIAQMRIDEEMSLRVTNREGRSLYVAVIAIERDGDMYVYHPSHWHAAELEAELGDGESVVIPKDDDMFYLPVQGPPGYFEVLVIASTEQLRDTLLSLQRLSDPASGNRGQLLLFTDADERTRGPNDSAFSIVQDILGDVNRNANAPYAMREQYSVNTSQLAALSVTIEVVES